MQSCLSLGLPFTLCCLFIKWAVHPLGNMPHSQKHLTSKSTRYGDHTGCELPCEFSLMSIPAYIFDEKKAEIKVHRSVYKLRY